MDFVLENSYNPSYGARPVRRYLEKNITTALSRMIISGELENDSVVDINASNDGTKLNFHVYSMSHNPHDDHHPTSHGAAGNSSRKYNKGNNVKMMETMDIDDYEDIGHNEDPTLPPIH